MSDEFHQLLGDQKAQVGMDFGVTTEIYREWYKINTTIRLTCGQNEKMLDRAGELCLKKAQEFTSTTLELLQKKLEQSRGGP